jgi:hypothetical protein
MSITSIEKRLGDLECKNVRRIATLADYVIWCAHGCPDLDLIEWDPKFLDALPELGHIVKQHQGN